MIFTVIFLVGVMVVMALLGLAAYLDIKDYDDRLRSFQKPRDDDDGS